MKSKLSLIAGIVIGGLLFSATVASAVSTFNVGQGGTGANSFTSSGLVTGNGTNPLYTTGTTTVTCSGATSCTSFVIPGSTPITITSATSGSSPIATSTNEIANRLALWTSTSGTPATLGQVGSGTNGFVLALVGGVPTFVATSSINNGVTSITVPQGTFNGALTFATTSNTTNGITSSLTITGSGSTLTFGSNQSGTLTVAGGGTGATTLTGCLTGNGTGAITGSGTCNTSAASVTSITAGLGLNGGVITTAGTIALKSYIATSSAETANQIPVWSSTSATPATLSGGFSGYTLTSLLLSATNASTTQLTASTGLQIPNSSNPTPTISGYITQSTNAPYQIHTGNNAAGTTVFDPRVAFTFGIATSTTWTGTTTAPSVPIPTGLTWTSISCTVQPSGATLNAQYQYANPTAYTSVFPTMIPASTTPGVYVLSSNNTPTTNATSTISFGTPTGSPTNASCTLMGTITGI